jgi:hypothetical protein
MWESEFKVWVIYQPEKRDYDVSIGKEELLQILQWKEISSYLYYKINDEIVRRKLFFVLTDTSSAQYEWAKIIWDEDAIKMGIAKELLENLLNFKGNVYEHRYNPYWDKIQFSLEWKNDHWLMQFRGWLSQDIELYVEYAHDK